MECFIYRSRKKNGAYLFLPEEDNFRALPEALLKTFGIPEYSFSFTLTPDKSLAMVDVKEVIAGIEQQGYFMQLTPLDQFRVGDVKIEDRIG
ncbi:MAG: YcgL domain-containing protein [bacterium]